MKKIIVLLCFVLVLVAQANAGVGSSSGFQFLKLMAGARPLGMGEAFTGLADDASAMFFNPGGLSQVNYPEVLSMYNNWLADTNQQVLAIAYPIKNGTLAFGYSALNSGSIQGYDQNGAATSAFTTSSSSLNVSYGKKVNESLGLGIGAKLISERLENNQAGTWALDAGALYRFNPQVTLGASVLNFGSAAKFIAENTALPTSYRLGINYNSKFLKEDLNLASDIVSYAESTKINFGMEYTIRNLLVVRAGSQAGALRAGLGILANVFSFDYAYLSNPDLGATHQFSINVLFGAPEKAKADFLVNLGYGKAYLKAENYQKAIDRFQAALDLSPSNEDAANYLKVAQGELEKQIFERVFSEKSSDIKRGAAEMIASGKSFMSQGKYLEALGEFSNALKVDATNREALKLQADAQFKMESQLIGKSKEESSQLLSEATKLVINQDYKGALAKVNKALEVNPKNKEALTLKKKLELINKIENK